MPARATDGVARKIFLIATEESGDRLGANLMKVLRQRLGGAVRFEGVGGRAMAREGLASLFPIEELSIIGLAGGRQAVAEDPAADPANRRCGDCKPRPIFSSSSTAPISPIGWRRRVRARDPSIPIVDYVSPSVWAWRPGRARAMRALCRSCAGAAAVRAGGLSPAARAALQLCRPSPDRADRHAAARCRRADSAGTAQPPVLLVLPGSRRSEIRHHMAVFGETLGLLQAEGVPFELILPTMPHLQEAVARRRQGLAGAAADRGRRAGKAGGVPDRACGLGQIRHRDARARARGRADGRGLSGRRGRGLDRAARDHASVRSSWPIW